MNQGISASIGNSLRPFKRMSAGIMIKHFMLLAILCGVLSASAKTSENFNSRKGVPIRHLKASLQNSCWTFHHFDINHNGWNPGIEGDGAMVFDQTAAPVGNSGIYTPLLTVGNDITVSFDYTFNDNFSGTTRRWIKLCLTNAANEIMQVLENIEFDGVNAVKLKKYQTKFSNLSPGEYRLALQYGGYGGTTRIAIDELNVSAPFKYASGCNTAPVITRDKITGMSNRSASGSLLLNDSDNDKETLTAYLIKGSVDGKVILNEDGNFTFTPEIGFEGKSTSFIYKVCDDGGVNLCSENKTVYINFPDHPKTAGLEDFRGSYKQSGKVELIWTINKDYNNSHFEIERSTDGQTWINSGTVDADDVNTNINGYTYIDKVSRQAALKKDLYYRLKQVTDNGSTSLSRLLIVRVYNTKTLGMISVTPNPAKNDIAVNIQLHESSYVSMRIINSIGEPVIYKSIEAERGTSNLIINGSSSLKPGLYLLEVIVNSKERMLVKLIKE